MSILPRTLKVSLCNNFSTSTELRLKRECSPALRVGLLSTAVMKSERQPSQLMIVASMDTALSKLLTAIFHSEKPHSLKQPFRHDQGKRSFQTPSRLNCFFHHQAEPSKEEPLVSQKMPMTHPSQQPSQLDHLVCCEARCLVRWI